MAQNIVEYVREQAVGQLFAASGFAGAWPTWHSEIGRLASACTEHQIYDLGDHLRDIFYTTNTSSARTQSDVSGGGANWEALVCWYLNLCLIGRRTVVIKHSAKLIPPCISDAITVNYGTFPSNTESDLIALTFPDLPEYSCDKDAIAVTDQNGNAVRPYKTKKSKYNVLEIMDALCSRDFTKLEIHIIQCKTNWNDNAQIPMLWDAVYSATNFRSGVTVGLNGYSIADAGRFTYSFVTVPTVKLEKIKKDSVCVLRVMYLSGGNYWGMPSKVGVASSVKEMLNRNLKAGHTDSHITTIKAFLPELATTYQYFRM